MRKIVNYLKKKHLIHSWIKNNPEGYRFCSSCGAIESFLYDSQGGCYYPIADFEQDKFKKAKEEYYNLIKQSLKP